MKRLCTIVLAATVAACSAGRPRAPALPSAVEVVNQAFVDMTVYVQETTGSRRRLGFAPGASTVFLRLPASLIGLGREIHFVVDPIGSNRTAVSNRLYVSPGDTVRLTIPPR